MNRSQLEQLIREEMAGLRNKIDEAFPQEENDGITYTPEDIKSAFKAGFDRSKRYSSVEDAWEKYQTFLTTGTVET